VPIHDDPLFEQYLEQFRPLDPEPLPKRQKVAWGKLAPFSWATAAIVIVGASSLSIYLRAHRTHSSLGGGQSTGQEAAGDRLVSSKPLTTGSANTLLVTGPSFEQAIDEITKAPETVPLPNGKHSALAVLSKGPTKL
jgi:hypothetical protein